MEKKEQSSDNHKEPMEELMKFPTDYEFKIMGKSDELRIEEIVKEIELIIENIIPDGSVRNRESSGKKYTSYSVKVYLEEYGHLKRIYEVLKGNKSIKYYL
jgi:putative lipoic acid-binding regulatory protein